MVAAPPSVAATLTGRYVLDTDMLVDLLRKRGRAHAHLQLMSPDDVAVTAMSLAELEYGALGSADPRANRAAYMTLVSPLRVLVFGRRAALVHADLRLKLRSVPIGPADLIIAAITLAARATLVTANTNHFGRVPGLVLENWR